jgi:hypothetical protein
MNDHPVDDSTASPNDRAAECPTDDVRIFLDGDACPVKDETYRVAERYGLRVYLVSNQALFAPSRANVEPVVVKGSFNAADNWIVRHAGRFDVVVTADIPLAERCLDIGCGVIGHRGDSFAAKTIGRRTADRAIAELLRASGEITGGPKPFAAKHRSAFLGKLDEIINAKRRERTRERNLGREPDAETR